MGRPVGTKNRTIQMDDAYFNKIKELSKMALN